MYISDIDIMQLKLVSGGRTECGDSVRLSKFTPCETGIMNPPETPFAAYPAGL